MRNPVPLQLRKHRGSGIIRVAIRTPRGKQWVTTGQTTRDDARKVCTAAMVQELQMAACANALTPDVISRLTTGRRFTCADILDAWKADAAIDLAPDSFNAYVTTLAQWMEFCECAREPLSSLKRTHLDAFVNQKDVAHGTRRARLASLRSYYKFASAAGYCVGNMSERVKAKRRDLLFEYLQTKETPPITDEEYRRLMASPKLTGFYRWATALAYNLGWRFRDAACLQVASLQESVATIFVRKTGRRLELPLDDVLLGGGELRRVMLEIVEQTPAGSKFCFPNERALAEDPKRRAGLSVAYQRILRRHGIEGKRFHSLRHSHAVRLKDAGLTLDEIALKLGHASTETTKIYTDHENPA